MEMKRALVTRPREEAHELAAALAARGIDALIEPLMEIHYRTAEGLDLRGVQAVLCTSANGVRAFARATRERRLPLFAVGDATAARARAEGFEHIASAAGDVGDLGRLCAAQLRPEAGRLLHVAGSVVAGDLAADLARRGFAVERLVLYEARPVAALSPEAVAALAEGTIGVVLFFSPRTAALFARLAAAAGLERQLAAVSAVSISRAADDALTGLPWRARHIAERPNRTALLDALDIALGGHGGGARELNSQSGWCGMTNASETRTTPRPPGRRAKWAAMFFALLLVIVLGGVGSSPYWAPQVRPLLPWTPAPASSAGQYSRLAARLASFEAGSRASAAAAASAAQQNDKAIAATAAQLRTLDQRVIALEAKASTRSAIDPAVIAGMQKKLGELAASLADLEKRPTASAAATAPQPAAGAAPQATVAKLAQEIAALAARSQSRAELLRTELAKVEAEETRLDAVTAGLADRVPALAAELHQHRAAGHIDAALFLGLLQLRQALAEGRPFPQEYKAFLTLAHDWPDLAAAAKPLADAAKTGVASRVALLRQLAELSGRIAVKTPLPQKKDWGSRLAAGVASLVKIRHIDEKGAPGPQAAVDAAQLALAHNDLAGAVKALSPLSGPAGAAAGPWLGLAQQRLAAETALAQLQDLMVRELVGAYPAAAVPAAPAAPTRALPATGKKSGAPS